MRTTQKQGRARGRGQRKPGNGNALNRVHESSGPEGKVRGTPQQIVDKYLALARDSQTAGDRVTAENFLQHAEHYQRILTQAAQSQQAERRDESEAEGEAQSGAGNGAGPGRTSSEALTTIETEGEGEGSELLVEEPAPAESSPAAAPAEAPKKPRGRKPKAPSLAAEDAPPGTEGNGHDRGEDAGPAMPRRSRARRSGTSEEAGEADTTDSQTPTSGAGATEASTGNG